jgi:hypothetical protein
MSVRWYYVIHDDFPLSCLYETNLKFIDENIRLLGVNAQIPKNIPAILQDYVIHERQLPWYNPFLQYNNFSQDSPYYHVVKNAPIMLDPFEYVGFIPAKSKLSNQTLYSMQAKIAENPEKKFLFYAEHMIAYDRLTQHIGIHGWELVIKKYNEMYGSNHDITRAIASMIPIKNIFAVPKDILKEMIHFAEKTVPILFELLGYKTDLLPYHTEILYSLFFMMQGWDRKLSEMVKLPIQDV